MYKTVFGKPYATPKLMDVLKRAIIDQKFLFEPSDGLVDHMRELEELWDELTVEFDQRNFLKDISVRRDVTPPPGFVRLLRDNFQRYLLPEPGLVKPRIPREQRIEMLQYQIQALQKQLEQVQTGEEPPEETKQQMFERLDREHAKRLEGIESCFDYNLRIRRVPLRFSTLMPGKFVPGWLDDPL
jgi:hypothetical protein